MPFEGLEQEECAQGMHISRPTFHRVLESARQKVADALLADVIGITGTAFNNHTIERLLGLCQPQAYVIILGGTAPLSPVLFDYGVDAISGTQVVDPEMVLRCVSQGATFRQIKESVYLL